MPVPRATKLAACSVHTFAELNRIISAGIEIATAEGDAMAVNHLKAIIILLTKRCCDDLAFILDCSSFYEIEAQAILDHARTSPHSD